MPTALLHPNVLALAAPAELQAAGEGDSPQRPARITVQAYSGGIMTPPRFGPLVIDLMGVSWSGPIPILADHDATLAGVAGAGEPRIEAGRRLVVTGTLAPGPAGDRIRELASAGVPLQASVGLSISRHRQVRPGDTATVNGQTITAAPGGLLVVEAGVLREVSVLPLGADSTTTISVAARRGISMSINAFEHATVPADLKAERERIKAIRDLCAGAYPEIEEQAIDEDWTIPQVKAALFDAGGRQRALEELRASRPSAPGIALGGGSAVSDRSTLEAGLLLRAGFEDLAVRAYGERTVGSAASLRLRSLVDVCAAALRLEHRDPAGMGKAELVQAAFSTLSLPTALSNTMGKALVDSYMEATASWRGFCRVLSAADFKPQTAIRPSFVGELEKLPKDGEIKHGSMAEATYPWQIDTYAKLFTVDRQAVVNDDLGFIAEAPTLMGKAAARKLNDLIYSVIMANAGSFFATGNNNLMTGSPSALDHDSFGAAVRKMREQRGDNGEDLQIAPRVLAAPPALEETARSIVVSTAVNTTIASGDPTKVPDANVWRGLVDVVIEPRLSNSGKFSGASDTAWYIFAGPMDAPVIVGFLDGRQQPVVESFGLGQDTNKLALTFRCYHDFGAALGDYRAAVKAAGA